MTIDNNTPEEKSNWLSILGRSLRQDLLPVLTNLKLAIIMLLVIAAFSITGTIIEQGQSSAFYQSNYPENPALFGFITWKFILLTGLDHVYRTWWFLALLILFGTSLTACTFTRQLPTLKAARRWKFYEQPKQFQKLALSAEFENASLHYLPEILKKRKYQVFQEEDKSDILYARKGLVGRIGPIVVHIGIVVTLLGSIWVQ